MAESQPSGPPSQNPPSYPQLHPSPDDNSSATTVTPLLGGSISRSRAYSQSYHPNDNRNGVPLRRGSTTGIQKGYGTGLHHLKQGETKELPTAMMTWNISPGRIRKRIFGLAGILFFGSGILWLLARSYYDSADYELEGVHKPAPTLIRVNPPAHAEKNEYIHLITLPFNIHSPLAPPNHPVHGKPGDRRFRRLILIGDVHGAYDELKELLDKVGFDSTSGADHVVFTGDVVAKGPKSGQVLDLLKKLEDREVGSCVRGNHDDRVLKAYHRLHQNAEGGEEGEEDDEEGGEEDNEEDNDGQGRVEDVEGDGALEEMHGDLIEVQDKYSKRGKRRRQRKRTSDEAVAKTLTSAQAKYLAGCPLILRIPRAGHNGGELLVVHAGIVPGIPLLKQDPKLLMNMRTIISPEDKNHKGDIQIGKGSRTRKGRHWAEIWNKWEESRVKGKFILGEEETVVTDVLWEGVDEGRELGTTVVYGHYAAKGLDLRKWTKGLDSNCVRGGALSALIVEPKKDKKTGDEGDVEMEVVSVKCKKYVD